MTKHLHHESFIDHFLQADILSKLAAAESPIRFSDLKRDGIENSLFMYHVNKMIARGLVAKTDAGFSLTLKGVRWANYAGALHDFSINTPRPLVQFIVRDKNNEVLLAVRRGQLREQLNDYLLPGNIYRYGLSLEANASLILSEIFGDSVSALPKLLTVADIINRFEDGFVHHVISYIFTLRIDHPRKLLEHPLFTTLWMPLNDIHQDNPIFEKSAFLPVLFNKLDNIRPHEVFEIDSK